MTLHCHITIAQSVQFTLWFILGAVHSIDLEKCIMACIQHYCIIQSSFIALKILSAPLFHPSPDQPLETTDLFTISSVLLLPESPIDGKYSMWPFQSGFFHLIICTLVLPCLFVT